MIAAIPTEEQVPILETPVMEFIHELYGGYGAFSDRINLELSNRLHAGAAKYGTAWNEVDLTEDLREEILDAMNYAAMLLVRRSYGNPRGNYDDVLIGMIGEQLMGLYKMVTVLEGCEGPTSKDWVDQRNDKGAQLRFQEVLNGFKGEGQS